VGEGVRATYEKAFSPLPHNSLPLGLPGHHLVGLLQGLGEFGLVRAAGL